MKGGVIARLREVAKGRLVAGAVLYDGETSASFGDGLFALPIRTLWETTRTSTGRG